MIYQSMVVYPSDAIQDWSCCGKMANELTRSMGLTVGASATMVSTVLNELIENAMKYSAMDSLPVRIQWGVTANGFEAKITNWSTKIQAKRTLNFIRFVRNTISTNGYIRYLYKQATSKSPHSKMGLMGICHDYPVTLQARMGGIPTESSLCQITITVGGDRKEVSAIC